ncbi:hypothetical protein EVAR_37753_1 [Eumeta japonica]|uniref:Uncharacterized protein n=1 Tax=Eumeta variegata TaxID=151549 RepID=A0A4C1WLM8_EUMVA|nr:hypothetical protein EVAR_37753_1 [Eumeta japonica]
MVTYAVPVFAHADPNTLYQLEILQNNFCKSFRRTLARRNDILHLELPTTARYMQDMSINLFDIAANHPNPLLQSAALYEAPPPQHFIRKPRNILSGPPDEFTAEVERLIDINKNML